MSLVASLERQSCSLHFQQAAGAELITNVVKSRRGNHRLLVQISEFIEYLWAWAKKPPTTNKTNKKAYVSFVLQNRK